MCCCCCCCAPPRCCALAIAAAMALGGPEPCASSSASVIVGTSSPRPPPLADLSCAYLSENLPEEGPPPPPGPSRRSSLRREEMSCVNWRLVPGSNCRTSQNAFFSPGRCANSSASWYIFRESFTTRYTCFRSMIFFVHLCTTNPRSSIFTETIMLPWTKMRRGYFLLRNARTSASPWALLHMKTCSKLLSRSLAIIVRPRAMSSMVNSSREPRSP
mmetsp:Transcript_130058/g.315963  ORF Transcript_130058/g.315963 Transcript_130058/m.315963 type:complete len:216 (+) Transcript_130058:16-663(+)